MGLTERHWFEDEDVPETYEWALEDAVYDKHEAKSPVVREKNGHWNYVCPTCGSRNEELFREWNYCPFCGQAVKWNG